MKLHMCSRNTSIVSFVLNLGTSGKLRAPGRFTLGKNPCVNLRGG